MSHTSPTAADDVARADWDARIGLRRTGASGDGAVMLNAPTGLVATAGRAQVTLDWMTVPGAIGYQVLRSDTAAGPLTPLDHFGNDVLAVPHPPYADTTGEPGRVYHYAVAALRDIDEHGPVSGTVAVASLHADDPQTPATVRVAVNAAASTRSMDRPWRPMIGSEHLSHLRCTDHSGGRPIGAELAQALRIARDELGVESVRAHAILNDDLGVYREVDGVVVHDFALVDEVYDQVLAIGLRPVVELSFMPRDLATDPSATVFDYRAIISPPRDWERWSDLITALVTHLVDRYGIDEVRQWPFEVWNEANLEVFWSGTRDEFMRLYDVTAEAVKRVDPTLRVGGPASAAAGWVGELLRHVDASGAPLDFVSTHTYGSPPLDFRPICAEHGRPGLPLLWTEWGVTPRHFNPVSDSVFSAAFLLRGMRSAAGRIESLAYWVASDHFEELGRPPRLLHGGFGLLTVGNLRKPRFWALAALNQLGDDELPVALDGDGADSLVQAWAARDDDDLGLLVVNGTLDQSKAEGCEALRREVVIDLTGLHASRYRLDHRRIDETHSNIAAVWRELGDGADWPSDEQWEHLRARDTLDACEPDREVTPTDGRLCLTLDLPMPAISFIRLTPIAGDVA